MTNALFRRRAPKLLYFSNLQYIPALTLSDGDELDGLPTAQRVENFDIFCYVFSIFSYMVDIVLDIAVAYLHFSSERYWSGIFIAAFVVFPSLVLNTISLTWYIEDKYRIVLDTNLSPSPETPQPKSNGKNSVELLWRILACIFQVTPLTDLRKKGMFRWAQFCGI
jgi:hypothetical protein